MATQAQIAANQRNAQKSTGPRSDKGKAKSRENALKHGQRVFTLMPTLPSEDPQRIDERIQEWMDDVQPRNARERELTAQAAWLTIDLERAQRIGTGHMAHRVVVAARQREQTISPRERKRVHELGRKLLYLNGPEHIKVDKQPLGDDDPGLLVAELEDTAAGCRWLLDRWREYANLLERRTRWEEPVLIRFIRLLGKRLVEAVFDPEINLIFLAWDTIVPNYAREEWESYSEERSILDPAYTHRLKWREIAPRPKDVSEAWAVLYAIFERYVTRLEEVLAQNEASEAMLKQDPTWMDRAAMDYSPEFERLRRYQSARTRELHKTLELLNTMRESECEMAEGETGVASGQWPVASEEEPTEGAEEAVEVVAEGEMTPEKAPNEANLGSTQDVDCQEVETETRGLAKRERSQSAAGKQAARDTGTRGGKTRAISDQVVQGANGETITTGEALEARASRDARPVTTTVESDGALVEPVLTGQIH